jgi:DNA-binding NarL/FixJ family response regulator
MNNIRVIILTSNTLAAIGLRALLREHFAIEALVGESNYINTFHSSREPDMFFVDSNTLVSSLGFFLPRKAKTILLTANETVDSDELKSLNMTQNENQLIACLATLLEEEKKEEKATSGALSQRETEVLRLIASGRMNKEIAQELGISINTVLTHRKNITAKLGIKSVSGLSFYAMMNGIV